MSTTKRIALWFSVPLVILIVIAALANRDLVRIYGGLTDVVDSGRFLPRNGPLAITNVHVLSPDGERFIADQTVYLENGHIVATGEPPEGKTFTRWDAEGKYLIPGLVDAHTHLFKSPNDLLLYVANGITQIRELIGEEDHLKWRAEVANGTRIGPDMFIASPRIGSFGGLEGQFMEWSQGYINLTNAAEAEAAVEQFHAQGYDAIKIYSQINRETYEAAARTARLRGMKVVGHVPWDLTLDDVYRYQDSVAHLEEIMNAFNREFGDFGAESADEFLEYVERRSHEIAGDMIANDVALTTTLWLVQSFVRQKRELDTVLKEVELEYENPGISEWSRTTPRGLGWLPDVNRYRWPDDFSDEDRARSTIYWTTYADACERILTILADKGVLIMAGTDTNLPPMVPGFSLHDEFLSLANAGMTPADILRSATSVPADWLGNNAGRIEPGRKANLVLLNDNPLQDIGHTRTIQAVFVNGRVFDRRMLDNLLAAVEAANDSSRRENIDRYL